MWKAWGMWAPPKGVLTPHCRVNVVPAGRTALWLEFELRATGVRLPRAPLDACAFPHCPCSNKGGREEFTFLDLQLGFQNTWCVSVLRPPDKTP